MKTVLLFSILLVAGLVGSQFLPALAGEAHGQMASVVRVLTMIALSFIMIHVGYEFEIDKSNVRQYGWDYVVAFTAASFPWILVTLYFIYVMLPSEAWSSWDAWKGALLAGRFSAPTSAGVLFSMLAAAGLSASWVFRKARVLAIFDDLDTVLLMIPLKMMMVGLAWQLGLIVVVIAALLWMAWQWLHRVAIPVTWPWVLSYSAGIVAVSELLYAFSNVIDDSVPIHIEVLLPAFVLGCMLQRPAGSDPHSDDAREGHQEGPEGCQEQRVKLAVSACFMVLVGLSMPPIINVGSAEAPVNAAASGAAELFSSQPFPGWGTILLHVLWITVLSNLGKMFPAFCYRCKAHWRERLAVAIGMWPRGEVGAGVLVVSLSYGIGGPVVTVAILSLALNLLLTGVFIYFVKRLLIEVPSMRIKPARQLP